MSSGARRRKRHEQKITGFAFGAAFFALCSPATAQQTGKVHRIGLLIPSSQSGYATRIDALRKGLRELRYVEGQNIVIESRYAEGKADRLPDLAIDLVRLKVELIVTAGRPAVLAVQKASITTPIVFTEVGGDPVETGLVSSLAKPGGNVTGLTIFGTELNGKSSNSSRKHFLRSHEWPFSSKLTAALRRAWASETPKPQLRH